MPEMLGMDLTIGLIAVPIFGIAHPLSFWLLYALSVFAAYLLHIGCTYAILSIVMRRFTQPAITLSPAGISVRYFQIDLGLIPWDEIEKVRVCASAIQGACVGIVLKDMEQLASRLPTRHGSGIRMGAAYLQHMPQWTQKYIEPIAIMEEFLPIRAGEMVRQIKDYRQALESGEHA